MSSDRFPSLVLFALLAGPSGCGGPDPVRPKPDTSECADPEDADGDQYPAAPCGEDCDDTDPNVHPEAVEQWYDGVDGDCDGRSDFDADGDGEDAVAFGGRDCDDDDPTWADGDADGDGHSACDGDCDDGDPDMHPDAAPLCGNDFDDNCDGVADCLLDGELDPEVDAYASVVGAVGDLIGSRFLAADLDDDGSPELLTFSPYVGRVWLLSPPISGQASVETAEVSWDMPVETMGVGDVNGDGILDAVMGSDSLFDFQGARVFLGPLVDVPVPAAEISPDFSGGMVAVGDLDGVGAADVALGFQDWGVHVFASPLQAFSGTDDAHSFVELGVPANSGTLEWGDFTGDGVGDLLIGTTDNYGSVVRLFAGPLPAGTTPVEEAAATLSALDDPELSGMETLRSQPGDVNGDGYSDMLLVGRDVGLLQNGSAGFVFAGPIDGPLGFEDAVGTIVPHAAIPPGALAVGVGDIDGDGLGDCGIHAYAFGADIAYGPVMGTVETANNGIQIVAADPFWNAGLLHPVGDLSGDGLAEVAFATQLYPVGMADPLLNTGIIWLLQGGSSSGF